VVRCGGDRYRPYPSFNVQKDAIPGSFPAILTAKLSMHTIKNLAKLLVPMMVVVTSINPKPQN
jgi:hypothetical protein